MSSNNDKPLKDRGKGLEDEWIRQREAEQREQSERENPTPKKDKGPDEPAPKKREPLWPLFLALLALGSVIAMIWFH